MVMENTESQFADGHDAQRSGETANWSGNEPKGRRKKISVLQRKSGETTNSPTFTPTTEVQQHLMIAEAAYYRAEKRGFGEGYHLDDWLIAEAEITGIHST